jgi:hypothetical protein
MKRPGRKPSLGIAFWVVFFSPALLGAQQAQPTPTPAQSVKPVPLPGWNYGGGGLVNGGEAYPYSQEKDPNWLFLVAFGGDFPLSSGFAESYEDGFCGHVGLGYKAADLLTAWLDLGYGQFGSRNSPSKNAVDDLSIFDISLQARYRLFSSRFSPFFFAGPGLTVATVENAPATSDTGLLLEGGAGMEYKIGGGKRVFLQCQLSYGFLSPSFAAESRTDSPLVLAPLEFGMTFSL